MLLIVLLMLGPLAVRRAERSPRAVQRRRLRRRSRASRERPEPTWVERAELRPHDEAIVGRSAGAGS